MEDLHHNIINIVVYHDNVHAYNAIAKAITDAVFKQADLLRIEILNE